MVGKLVEQVQEETVKLNKQTLDIIYQHTWFLANFRFSRPVEVLQTRHVGYGKEDFVQEVVLEVVRLFEKGKTFPTINHLKKMIRSTMTYHYLKEKRKYFWTKARGGAYCTSFDEDVNDYRKVEDTVIVDKSFDNESIYDLNRFYEKNLYVAYDWVKPVVITKDEFKQYKTHYILSVNFMIDKIRAYGINETCKFYKEHGCYITKGILDTISQSIIDYAKANDLLSIEEERQPVMVRPRERKSDELIHQQMYTCECGYVHEGTDQLYWQCPECGRIHDKQALYAYQNNKTSEYHSEKLRMYSDNLPELIRINPMDSKDSLEVTRKNLMKMFNEEYIYNYNDQESSTEDILDTSDELLMV